MNRQEIKHILTAYHNMDRSMELRDAIKQAEKDLVEYEQLLQPCNIVSAEYPEGYCTVHESSSGSMYSGKCDAAMSGS